ncbi:four helix bundle protein [candidate division WS5 bacterium]|uniref:Four helix bundle protein n=1 Tax=candidate division WS5 bacterium TaxID=2093353 RepID=A0A419DDT9_9BACT|nr:MAG: four helix bundle protein [candidate division WS5 bacterium]
MKPRDIKDRTFEFALEVVRLCREFNEKTWVSKTLGKQLLRSGTSVGANVEEAQAGQSRADFVNKYAIALKEARETIYWLRLLHESNEHADKQIKKLQHEAEEVAKVIGAIIVSAKRNQKK